MKNFKKIAIAILSAITFNQSHAQLLLPKILGNNMVLQRNKPVPLWGKANAGDDIAIQFNHQSKTTKADGQGNWKLTLDAMEASSDPEKLTITNGKQTITLNNILVGEVWICSGQSNMEYPMRRNDKVTVPAGVTNWPVNEVQTAHNSNIRIFLVDRKKMKPDSTHAGWSIAEDSALKSFSAVGYFFAKELYSRLKVPVGVISSAIPGSRIEPWMPKEAFTALPFFNSQPDSIHKIDGEPGKFYATMIEPLEPFAIKGFLWYQGESNCFLNERIQYTYKMQALINWWRKAWGSNLPFYYVQIAPYAYSKTKDSTKQYTTESLPEFWEAQTTALKIPSTGMIATTDLNFDLDNLHPHFKWEVGRRLALCALGKAYGHRDLVPMGPIYTGMKIQGDKIILDFNYTGNGLISKDGKPLGNFEIAGADGKFIPAKAEIKNDEIIVSAETVAQPVAARFGWNEGAHPNLYNSDGLPALPFRTNNPLKENFK
jgi:Domain of unknown function (DUF303).